MPKGSSAAVKSSTEMASSSSAVAHSSSSMLPSSSAGSSSSSSSFVTPKKRSLKDFIIQNEQETSASKMSFSPGNHGRNHGRDLISIVVHVLEYDGGDSEALSSWSLCLILLLCKFAQICL